MQRFWTMIAIGSMASALSAATVEVGTGTLYYETPALSRPFSADAGRYQVLVLSEQIAEFAGRKLAAVAFDAVTYPEGTAAVFDNVIIRILHTPLGALIHMFAQNYGDNIPSEVLATEKLTLAWTERGWHRIEFDTPFEFDGEHNLLIEFQHDGSEEPVMVRTTRWASEPGRILDGTVTAAPGALRQRDGGASVRGFLREYMNAMQLIFSPEEE